ncbi:wall-associated receptor kinase 3-like isoform X1 [Hordeum vulgare subsp. vulgare]|uniref:wall-associated receptor kinase 3-like isoform X1 n=1 Tax=Hordeum vulgare subsp. vulgare TaxID=112509 RepID=UPI001D1A4405|nr:wall-associated receptor kinase 3-like isoform X1 [Hordeum vulgare subsp. vulgare]
MDVPHPFGIGPVGCYWPGFELTCDRSSNPPRLFLDSEGDLLSVQEISLRNNTVRVLVDGATKLLTSMFFRSDGSLDSVFRGSGDTPYSLLANSNELILIGCNVQAFLLDIDGQATITGCTSFCPVTRSTGNTYASRQVPSGGSDRYCYGIGCCQARISLSPNNMPVSWEISIIDENQVTQGKNSSPPVMLIAAEGWFDQRQVSDMLARDFQHHRSVSRSELHVPVILQWEVVQGLPDQPADAKSQHLTTTICPAEVAKAVCKSKHSDCKRGSRGYLCQCSNGYDGNPYDQHGCKGNTYSPSCTISCICIRRIYRFCFFLPGGLMSLNTGIYIIVGVAIGAAVIFSFFIAFFISKKIKHRRAQMLKRHFFLKNRGQVLQQLVSQRADIAERMVITLEEIEKATNNFDKTRELGGGGHGVVYKGILSDLHVVAIKKPKRVVQKEIDEFINEVAILSQINHRNVVKLYGCCLETEVPLLVYEFISNGTLYEHLHVEGPRSLSLDDRLRIATETAKSLAYLHSTASIPIIHRDIKSANILLDDTLMAKVADFGASRYIPMDRSGVTTMVQGTIGYLDPMYFYTQRLTEKSDVYSFGVILIELWTRKKPFAYISTDGEGLVAHFSALFAEGNLSQILDQQVIDEGGKEVEEVAALAKACVQLRGEDRPTMRQVELTLEGLPVYRKYMVDSVSAQEFERNGILINGPWVGDERSSEESSRQYSMEEEYMLSSRYPR